MFFKLTLLITLLFVTSYADEIGRDRSLRVENEWRKSASSRRKPAWISPVQNYYNNVLVSFGTFRSNNGTNYADVVKTSMQKHLVELIASSNSESEILSTGATVMLEAFSHINIEVYSAQGIINEFYRMLPILMRAYRGAATNLTTILGNELVNVVNVTLTDLERAFRLYMDKFNADGANGVKIVVDYTPVTVILQKLQDIIALKGDVTLSECQLANSRVQDALAVLNLVLDHITICYNGVRGCSESILLEQNFVEPDCI